MNEDKWHDTPVGLITGLAIISMFGVTMAFIIGVCVAIGIKGYQFGMGI